MKRFEKEVLNIEAKEEEKMSLSAINAPRETFEMKNYDFSSLNNEIAQEFKDAKWVVLTTPAV